MTSPTLHGAGRTSLLLKGSALRMGTLVFNICATFFLMPFLVHNLGDRTYGMWALIGAIVGYYHLIDFGLATATQRYMAVANARRDAEQANRVYSTSLLLFGALGLLALLLAFVVALFSSRMFPDPAEAELFFQVVLIAGADIALSFPFYAVMGALTARLRYDLMSYVNLVRSAVRVGLSFYVIIAGYGLIGLALVQLGCNLAAYGTQYLMMRWAVPGVGFAARLVDRGTARELFHFGKYVFLGNLSSQMQFRAANLIVAPMLGLAAVTQYAIAARLVDYNRELLSRAFRLMGPVFTEYYTRGDMDNLRAKFLTSTRLTAIAAMWLTGGIVIVGRDFISAWMGPEYVQAYLPLVVLAIGTACGQAQIVTSDLLTAIHRNRVLAISNFAEACTSVLLSIYLSGRYGLIGVALGVAIPVCLNKLLWIPTYACRQIGLSLAAYWLSLLRVAVPMIALQAPAWYIFHTWKFSGLLEIILIAVTYYAAIVPVAFSLILPSGDRDYFYAVLPGLRRLSLRRASKP